MQKTIVITGSSDGIGAAAARTLASHGHTVAVVGRSAEKTNAVAHEIGGRAFVADFTRLDEVRDLAAHIDAEYPQIDVLANNAGGPFGDPTRTVDGFEQTFQVNHLAPFLLTTLLLDKLLASQASVLQTTTLHGGNTATLNLEDLNNERAALRPIRAYNAAKLQSVLFTKELHRRYHARGLSAAAFYPGIISGTSFSSDTTSAMFRVLASSRIAALLLRARTPNDGADQLVWLAESRSDVDWVSGEFYVNRQTGTRLNPLGNDETLARGLWDRSMELLTDRDAR